MKLRDAVIQAVEDQDGVTAVRIADFLRFKGMNYTDIFKLVSRIVPSLELADWDALLYEGEG